MPALLSAPALLGPRSLAAGLPASVRERVSGIVAELNRHNDAIAANRSYCGPFHAEAEATVRAARMNELRAELATFYRVSASLGYDGPGIVWELADAYAVCLAGRIAIVTTTRRGN